MNVNTPITLKELMEIEFPEQTWLVEGLVPASGITIMSAEPGSYKTYLLLETAIAVTKGELLFGEFETQRANVLMIDEDNDKWLLNKRFKQMGAESDLPIYFYSYDGFVINDKNISTVLGKCEELDIKLLMIDCLARIHTSDENIASDMSAVFKQLRRFTARGIAVLITHHNRKPGANQGSMRHEMRGSSDILASVDTHIALKRNDGVVTVEQTKQRFAVELKPFDLRISDKPDTFSIEYLGSSENAKTQTLKGEIVDLLREDDKLFQKQIFTKLKAAGVEINQRKLSTILKAMNKDGAISTTQGSGNTKYHSLPPELDH